MEKNSAKMDSCETFSFSIYQANYVFKNFKRTERNTQSTFKMYRNFKITVPSGNDLEVSIDEENFERFEHDYDYRNSLISQLSAQSVQNEAAEVGIQRRRGNEETEIFTYGHSQSSQQFLGQMPREIGEVTEFSQKRVWSVEDEETLIRHVMERPPLFDHTIPLRQRTRQILKNLWKEIIEEMNVDLDEEAISKKWKNMRDSYMRARCTINKKCASGSSSEQRHQADRMRKNHKHYELMSFLNKSLAARQTITNLEGIAGPSTDPGSPLLSPSHLSETPTTSRGTKGDASSSRDRHGQLSVQDEAFLGAIKELMPKEKREATPIEQFCSRLADGLSKLPRKVSNRLQVEFLSKLAEEENLYLD